MALTKEQMWEAATDRYIHIHKLYSDPSVSADSMFEELCCSVYGGDEWNEAREKPVKISEDEFKYRGIVFRITQDNTDDKSYIWCSKYNDSDDLVWWTWGAMLADRELLIDTNILDKFIDSQEKEH